MGTAVLFCFRRCYTRGKTTAGDTMAFDGFTMRCLALELRKTITNARIEKVYQPRPDTLLFHIHTGSGREKLLLSANPSSPRVHLTAESASSAQHPPMFCMLLRKHLTGANILSIDQHGMDRVLEFTMRTTDQLGEPGIRRLICEVMGRHSNIILLEQDGRIIDSVKRVSAQMSSYRHIFPGIEYKFPPDQAKLDISCSGRGDLERAFMQRLGIKASRAVSDTLEGMGKTMAREICVRGGADPDRPLDEECAKSIAAAALGLADLLQRKSFSAVIYYRDSELYDFSPVLLTHLNLPFERQQSVNTMLDNFFRQKSEAEAVSREKDYLLRVVTDFLEKCRRKLSGRLQDLQNAGDKSCYRLYGELITANLYRLKENISTIMLEDYTQPDSPVVEIKLDPNLTPLQNAQKFFEEYSRAKRAVENLRKLIRETKEEIDYLEGLSYSIESCTSIEELREIRQEIEKEGFIKPSKAFAKEKRPSSSGPNVYLSQDGFYIYVGRNNNQNDYLTQRFAKKDDLWLHTKDIPGSHVLVRSEGKEVPEGTLYQAALLAAFHSKARQSSSVPVDYTLVKHVSKPPGAKPGYVIYKNQRTIIVTPVRDEIDRIKQLQK